MLGAVSQACRLTHGNLPWQGLTGQKFELLIGRLDPL